MGTVQIYLRKWEEKQISLIVSWNSKKKYKREERNDVVEGQREIIEFRWYSYRNSCTKCKLPKLKECSK